MFERKHEKLVRPSVFFKRMVVSIAIAGLLVLCSLFIGISGYHWIVGLGWFDSLLNASMILGGMGPVNTLITKSAKVFASAYALFSGLVFIIALGIILAPIIHRVIHAFHMDDEGKKK